MSLEREKRIRRITWLVSRSAVGNITDDEQRELERWMESSQRARDIVRRFRDAEPTRRDVVRYLAVPDTDRAWSVLQRRMQSGRRTLLRRRIAGYAAAAVVVAAMAGSFLLLRGGMDSDPTPQIYSVAAGARLELPDGRVVALDEAALGIADVLTSQGAVAAGDSLVYTGADSVELADHRITVPRGGAYDLLLSDGTRIWLNSGTSIEFPNRFTGDQRRVKLDGEAYFDVAPHEGMPFMVETAGVDVRVTGTRFNVSAYEGDRVEVTLVEGRVEARAGSVTAALEPGMQATYDRASGELSTRRVDTAMFTSWREGVYQFKAATLRQIAAQIERWYDVELVFADPEIADIRFTGALKRENSVNYMLDMIRTTRAFEYRMDGKKIILKNR